MLKLFHITHKDSSILWAGMACTEEEAVSAYRHETLEEWPDDELEIRSEDDPE